jgi:putative transcriptional regulator
LLISEPFLCDNFFGRSVVLVVDHNADGTMGLILNKRLNVNLNTLIDDLKYIDNIPVYKGGPVGRDTLFYLHTLPDVAGSFSIGGGLYLNGDFEHIKRYILSGADYNSRIRFFLGYSCWESRQLEDEIAGNTWIVGREELTDIIHTGADCDLWKQMMSRQGSKYAIWSRFPQIPMMN